MIAGIIVDQGGYFMLENFFIVWLAIALIATIVMWIFDSSERGILNMSPHEREHHTKHSGGIVNRSQGPTDSEPLIN